MIFKRNNNNINSCKSFSLINKNKSPLNRPKSYEYKPNYIINNKNKDKNQILYNNKMSQIDKYLNIFTYDNNGKNYISFNKNRIKKNNSNENKVRIMKNMNINIAKDYNTDKGIFRKKNNKNSNNNIFKDYYISKDPYLRYKEEDNNKNEKFKNDKQLINQHTKMNIINSQKRIYNCKDIYCVESNKNKIKNKVKKENKGNKEKKGNKYEKIISTIQPNNNGKNKKMKRFIEGIFKYQKYKEIQLSETSNFYHKNSSERIKINNLNKIKSDNLNKDFGNNNIKEEKKETGSNTIDKVQQNLYKRSIPKNKNRKINNIPHSKKELHTISSHKDIYNKKDKYQNKLGMNTYNKFYINNFSAGKKRVIDNFSLNTDYQMDTYNTTNNENNNNNNISETHNNLNLNLLDNKINTDNYFRKRNNSSFNISNNQEKNISDIRRYLHNYYEIKNRNNIRKNNSFNNINNFYQKEKINNYIYKNNLLKNLIEEDKNNNNNNNYYNNLSSNVNININITPNQISNKSFDINVNDSNRNIMNKKNNSDNNNENNSIQILTPSFNRTKKELGNEGKISMQKFNMNNAFINYDIIRNENKESQNSQNMNKEQNYNQKKLKINEVGYDYTFKNNHYDYNIDDVNNEKQVNSNFCFKVDCEKRKEDLIQLLHFSENLGLNYNK